MKKLKCLSQVQSLASHDLVGKLRLQLLAAMQTATAKPTETATSADRFLALAFLLRLTTSFSWFFEHVVGCFFFLFFCPTRIIFMGKIRNLKGAVYVCKIKLEAARPSNSFLWFLFLKTLSCWNVAYFKGPLFSRQGNKSLFCGNLSFNDFLLNLRISENICSLIINLSRLLFFYH